MRHWLLAACLGLGLWACASARPGPGPDEGDLSVDREKELTADVHRQIRAQAPLISDPVVLDYLYELGQELVAVTEPQPFVYRFFIIEEDTLNAFTIGGGYVYINTETFLQAGDVNELAGLLAHEIAHVRKRHIARRSKGQHMATLATLAGIALVALGGDPALLAIPQALNVSLQLKYSREHEAESDREGVDYLVEAGYDPYGMSRFFQRILAAYGSHDDLPAYLYSHPALEERVAGVRVQVERLDHVPERRDDPRLPEMQARLATLLAPPVPGGSGLHARAEFDRERSDPLLDRAHAALCERPRAPAEDVVPCVPDEARARALLDEAERLEPLDPRIPLRRADLAERHGNAEQARLHLERAFELDPSVPLVQYRLGLAHKQLGNRSRAVFFLEQAIAHYRPGSSSRKRAELEIQRLEFPLLESSGLARVGALGFLADDEDGSAEDPEAHDVFERGDSIVWWGEIADPYKSQNPKLEVKWMDPSGRSAMTERVAMSPRGRVTSTFDSANARAGAWTVDVFVLDSHIQSRRFELRERP